MGALTAQDIELVGHGQFAEIGEFTRAHGARCTRVPIVKLNHGDPPDLHPDAVTIARGVKRNQASGFCADRIGQRAWISRQFRVKVLRAIDGMKQPSPAKRRPRSPLSEQSVNTEQVRTQGAGEMLVIVNVPAFKQRKGFVIGSVDRPQHGPMLYFRA